MNLINSILLNILELLDLIIVMIKKCTHSFTVGDIRFA